MVVLCVVCAVLCVLCILCQAMWDVKIYLVSCLSHIQHTTFRERRIWFESLGRAGPGHSVLAWLAEAGTDRDHECQLEITS